MRAFLVLEGGRLVHLANGASLQRLADEVTPYPPESRSPLWTACSVILMLGALGASSQLTRGSSASPACFSFAQTSPVASLMCALLARCPSASVLRDGPLKTIATMSSSHSLNGALSSRILWVCST